MDTASLLLLLLLLQASLATAAKLSNLAACLSSSGVTNFTVISAGEDDDAMIAYYGILEFSIQNLRFSGPSVPKPAAMILPETQKQLRSAVLCCRRALVTIRIRSGGHSYEGLSYIADAGDPFAVVDLMNLNRIYVDSETMTAWVEAGATLGETYYAIAEQTGGAFGFSAGSCPTVGIGGHVAGGGFGLLSRKYGLAADNVNDAIMIDAQGRVLNRSSMGNEIFWAIRGGGGGAWGALHAWKIKLLPVPPRVTGFIISRRGSTREVSELIYKWQIVAPNLPDNFYLSAFVGGSLPESSSSGFSATFKGLYLGPTDTAVSIIGEYFPELNVTASNCREMSWIESVLFFSGLEENSSVIDLTNRELQTKNYFKAKSDYVRSPIPKQELENFFNVLAEEPKAYVILDPYGGAMARRSSDELPFPHRGGNLYAIQYLVEWKDGSSDDAESHYVEYLRRLYEYMEPLVSHGPRAAYINYLDLDLGTTTAVGRRRTGGGNAVEEARAWGEKYFLGNFDRLVRAKTAIDPENVFANAQSIPPWDLAIPSAGEDDVVVV